MALIWVVGLLLATRGLQDCEAVNAVDLGVSTTGSKPTRTSPAKNTCRAFHNAAADTIAQPPNSPPNL